MKKTANTTMIKPVVLLCILSFINFGIVWGQTQNTAQTINYRLISGVALGIDNKPVATVVVNVVEALRKPGEILYQHTTNKGGEFLVQVPINKACKIAVSAPGYSTYEFPMFINPEAGVPERAEIIVRLSPIVFAPKPEIKIIGDWNNFDFAGAQTLKKLKNGTYSTTMKAISDTLAYQLVGVDGYDHSINGTQSHYWVYDGSGDFRSVLRTKKGSSVTIIFDPKKMPKSPDKSLPRVETTEQTLSYAITIIQIDRFINAEYYKTQKKYEEFVKKGGQKEQFTYNFEPLKSYLRAETNNADRPMTSRQYAGILLIEPISFTQKNEGDINLVKQMVFMNSPLWSYAPDAAWIRINNDETAKEECIRKNPDRLLRAKMLAFSCMTANSTGNAEAVKRYYTELKTSYSDAPLQEVQYVLKMVNPERAIAKGKSVPTFDVELLQRDTTLGERVSSAKLNGKYYLLDFWAVWCGPCRMELPGLHTMYEKFKDKLTVLSLSFDKKPEDVEQFRKDKWKMPWLHTFVHKGFSSDLAKSFEVQGIPKPILVAPDGTIVAMEGELRGETLEKTLIKHLGEPSKK